MHRTPLHGLAMWDITGGEPEEACLDGHQGPADMSSRVPRVHALLEVCSCLGSITR